MVPISFVIDEVLELELELVSTAVIEDMVVEGILDCKVIDVVNIELELEGTLLRVVTVVAVNVELDTNI